MRPFHPIVDSTVSIAATTSSASTPLKALPTGRFQLRLHNAGPSTAFVTRGDASVAATTSSLPIPSGAIEVITVTNAEANPVTHLAAITASGTATVYATLGEGV